MIMYMVHWFSYKMRCMHFCGTLCVAITSISQLIKTFGGTVGFGQAAHALQDALYPEIA